MPPGSTEHGAEKSTIPIPRGLRAFFQKLIKKAFYISRRDGAELHVSENVHYPGDPRFLSLPAVVMELGPCQVLRSMLAEGHLSSLLDPPCRAGCFGLLLP